MKKGIFAICMAAVMLTGCGSAAGSSESSKNDALATTAAAQQETEAKSRIRFVRRKKASLPCSLMTFGIYAASKKTFG